MKKPSPIKESPRAQEWATNARPIFQTDPEGQFVCRKCTISFEVVDGHPNGSDVVGCPDCGMHFRDHTRIDHTIAPQIDLDTYIKEGGELYNQGKCQVCGVALLGYNRVPRRLCGAHQ